VGVVALAAATLGGAACFFAGAATGGLPTIFGDACDDSLGLVSATCVEVGSVACAELDSLVALDGGVEGLFPSPVETVSCDVVSFGVVSSGVVSLGVVSAGVVSLGVVSVGVVSVGVVSSPVQ
jgi:hypothetical protein